MKVGVCYANANKQVWLTVEVADNTTLEEAVIQSGVLEQFPEIDLSTQKVGVFGRFKKLDALVNDGDRIEIYRPITCDPLTVPRRHVENEDD